MLSPHYHLNSRSQGSDNILYDHASYPSSSLSHSLTPPSLSLSLSLLFFSSTPYHPHASTHGCNLIRKYIVHISPTLLKFPQVGLPVLPFEIACFSPGKYQMEGPGIDRNPDSPEEDNFPVIQGKLAASDHPEG